MSPVPPEHVQVPCAQLPTDGVALRLPCMANTWWRGCASISPAIPLVNHSLQSNRSYYTPRSLVLCLYKMNVIAYYHPNVCSSEIIAPHPPGVTDLPTQNVLTPLAPISIWFPVLSANLSPWEHLSVT